MKKDTTFESLNSKSNPKNMSEFKLTIKNVKTYLDKLVAALAKDVEDVNLAIEGTDDEFSTEILPIFRATLLKHLGVDEDSDEEAEAPKKGAKGKKAPAKPAPKKPAASKTKKAPAKKPAAKGKAKPAPKGKKATAKPKKAKDPNAPKRPANAYIIYGQERRPTLKEEQPELKLGEVTQAIAAEWNEMSDKEKKPYQAQAAKAKAAYVKVKAAYDKKKATEDTEDEDAGDEQVEEEVEEEVDEE